MKFIGGIQNFKVDNNSISIKIPYYHRVATGLVSGAEVYLFPKILKTKNAAGLETEVKEIIISPFQPIDWLTIYEMELVMEDKPGLINLITGVLKENSINIQIQESLINNDERNFSVSLIVDVKHFQQKCLLSEQKVSMKEVLEQSFTSKGIHLEKFQPCKQLHNNSKYIQGQEKKTNCIDDEILANYYEPFYRPVQIIKKELVIGKQIIQDLFQESIDNAELQGTIFSDTDEKLIIVRFFNIDQHIVHFDIQHENRLGAISHYSSLIQQASASYNIISCYNRIENATETAHWYVLLDVSHEIDKLQGLFSKLNSTDKFTKKLNIHNYSRSIERLTLPELFRKFPSLSNIAADNRLKAKEAATEDKFQEALSQINLLKEEISAKHIEFMNTKRQIWIYVLLITLAVSYLIAKTITIAEVNKIWVIVLAIASGLYSLSHLLGAYEAIPKLVKRLTGKGKDKGSE